MSDIRRTINLKHSIGAVRGVLALCILLTLQPAAARSNAAPPTANDRVPALSAGDADEALLFTRYPILDPNVRFWTKVFGKWSDFHSIVHWTDRPDVVFRVIDLGAEAAVMDESSFRRMRNERENDEARDIANVLRSVHEKRAQPESLKGEERRLYQLLQKIPDDDKFLAAAENIRVQRGLADRTRGALEISGRYLPFMESVFESYGLPRGLTRLPLVESSFNVDAYSKVGAAGLWQFIPASARIYMRLDKVVDDRRDPWISTDAAARHLRDDFAKLKSWPLALTAYNFGRGGVARGLQQVGGTTLADLVRDYQHPRFGFASRNFYAEFLAAYDVERDWQLHFGDVRRETPWHFDEVRTQHYVSYETLRRTSGVELDEFRRLNPAYQGKVLSGHLYVPPGHVIRLPSGKAKQFEQAYAKLGSSELFDEQRVDHFYHRVQRGQTLSGIAGRYGVSMASIHANNRIGRNNVIRVGQQLKIVPRGGVLPDQPAPVSVARIESKRKAVSTQTHEVRPGQTLSEIADRYGVSQASIRANNRVGSGNLIRVGQELTIVGGKPAFHMHQVRSGQTLGSIAKRYGVSVSSIRDANGLGRSNLIRAGQQLRVPTSS